MDALGDFPDYVVACMGAGSNFAGVGMPFLRAARDAAEPACSWSPPSRSPARR